jgi:hypothetical protein
MNDFANFLLGFGFNLLAAVLVVRFIYYPSTHNKSYVFTFLAFNTIIYFVLSFLATIEIGLGVGFGLFAIFSILRYRTDPVPIREMTYLFVISALPVMNSAATSSTEIWPQLIAANVAILSILLVLEKEWGFHYEASKQIVYEKIELIRPEHRAELQADLEERTGLTIKRIVIGKMDFLRDVVNLKVYYDEQTQEGWLTQGSAAVVLIGKDEPAEF